MSTKPARRPKPKKPKGGTVTAAERAKAALSLKLMAQAAGPTPQKRVSWSLGLDDPLLRDDLGATEPTAAELRALSRHARYNKSEKGRARNAKYSQSPQRRAAIWREYKKRLQDRCDSGPARLTALQARLDAAGGWPT